MQKLVTSHEKDLQSDGRVAFLMCLWLLTACLGLLPANPSPPNVIVVQGVPTPIIVPTAAPTVAPTAAPTAASTAASTAATTAAPTMAPTAAPTIRSTAAPTMASTAAPTMASTAAPTMASTAAPTMAPTAAPTMASTAAPTMAPTAAPTMASTAAPTMAPTTAGAVALPVIICNNSDVVCVANPDETAGPLPIDPRLGTTPGSPAALQQPPITGYSAQVPNYDMAIKFPRQKRSTEKKIKTFLANMKGRHKIVKRQSCTCVPTGTCIRTGTNAGAGLIDIRIVTPGANTGQCPAGQEYCCSGTTTAQIACGTLQAVPAVTVTPAAGQANFGEFPWQAVILTKQNDYLAGGVLIDQLNVLTVTHRLVNYVVSGTAPNVKVRLGEWDAAGTYEPIAFQEFTVLKVFTHPSYNQNTLQFDITVLRLSLPVPLSPGIGSVPTINRACLPPASTTSYVGQRCMVAGWGKNMFGIQGQYQQILKKVEVPIVASATCQTQLQTARLGANYVLDTTSFVCAGGEAKKDSCTGDGGSGLVCQVNGQWVVVGLVAWGLGCASANVPGVYVNVAGLLPWIQQQVATP